MSLLLLFCGPPNNDPSVTDGVLLEDGVSLFLTEAGDYVLTEAA